MNFSAITDWVKSHADWMTGKNPTERALALALLKLEIGDRSGLFDLLGVASGMLSADGQARVQEILADLAKAGIKPG